MGSWKSAVCKTAASTPKVSGDFFAPKTGGFMKKLLSIALTLCLILSSFALFAAAQSQAYTAVTSTATPTATASLNWAVNFGGSVYTSPTPPVVTDDAVIVLSMNTLYKLSLETGEVIDSVEVSGSSGFNQVPVLVEEGKIFVQMSGGVIQAFDYDTMKSLWIYTDPLGGQALTPITYSDGYIYTGFWNGETAAANFVCVSTADEKTSSTNESKTAVWTYKNTGGFYASGAVVVENFVYFGSDNGSNTSTDSSKLICVNKLTGEVMDTVTLTGDLRSSAVYDSGRIYLTSKAGYVYSIKINLTTGNMADSWTYNYSYKTSGESTSTPIIYNDRLYVGAQDGTAGEFLVLESDDLSLIYKGAMQGNPQGAMLLSNYYEASTGKVYIYATYNNTPSGITMFEDSANQTTAISTEIYTPTDSYSQYGISSIAADADGNLYYKNDSGYIFCLESSNSSTNIFTYLINLINEFFSKILSFFTLGIL